MRSLLHSLLLKQASPAQAALAIALSFALLAVLVPVDALSASKLCSMPCCAGKAPHLAGSCAGGHCHANLSIVKNEAEPEHIHASETDTDESSASQESAMHMHGAQMVAEETHAPQRKVEEISVEVEGESPAPDNTAQTASANPEQALSIEAAALNRPCAPDCGMSAGNFMQLRRSRDSVALSTAEQPRPPTLVNFYARSDSLAFKASFLCRQCAPRGPPAVFS